MQYHIIRHGFTIGPYDSDQLTELLRAGQLRLEDQAQGEGCDDWQPVGNLIDPAAVAAPDVAKVAPQVTTKIDKVDRFGSGWVMQLFGLALIASGFFCPALIALVAWILGIALLLAGAMKVRYKVCGFCGNQVTKEARICPTCAASFFGA